MLSKTANPRRILDANFDDLTNVTDIVLTVDVVKDVFGAIWEYQTYGRGTPTEPPAPHLFATNVTDIVNHVDAVKLTPYQIAYDDCP